MSNNIAILTVVVLVSLRSSLATDRKANYEIEAEYLNITSHQRLQVSSFVSNAETEISNGTNEYSIEVETFERDILDELERFEDVQDQKDRINRDFEDLQKKIVREPRKIADAIFDIETKWKEHVTEKLDNAVEKLVEFQPNIANQCWENSKGKIEKNFDFFWKTVKSAVRVTREVMLERIDEAAKEIRSKVNLITKDLKICRNKHCVKSYVSH